MPKDLILYALFGGHFHFMNHIDLIMGMSPDTTQMIEPHDYIDKNTYQPVRGTFEENFLENFS